MRALRLASVAVTAAVLVGGLAACGDGKADTKSSEDPAAGKASGLEPKAALAASAVVMEKAANGNVELALPDNSMTGTAQWKQRTDIDVAGKGKASTKTRVVGDDIFLGGGPDVTAALAGKHWAKVTPQDPGVGPMAGMFLTVTQLSNPVLQLTVAAQAGKPTKVGAEAVGGVQTTHYRAVEDVAKLTEAMTALGSEQRAAVQQTLAAGGNTMTVDFWINGTQELVQLKGYSNKNGEQQAVTVKYSGLGTAAKIEAPAFGDVGKSSDFSRLFGG
ncbi:hypothetical protein [Streptomyces sp. CB01881]|uniref:hypothetical protein n=1 Tax=Streptomyces sp. CB01881 TaxID=2078691 RepID=UPI000CDC1B54|nr:hypothetical protein [Streptomyces sp. CB01881]AUY51290.1 hypothetical protein C2142_22755 [Streptomyces sp. CB01881]TYC74676.1 hypothetical protein EH183_22730 [Streptomyces sp. CB01881]